jgi:glucokinase
VIVVEQGNLCGCGRRGCLEAHASGRAIALRYRELVGAARRDAALDARQIAAAARTGDRTAIRVYEEAGNYLGAAIACAINILNPERVVLGGGVATDIDLFLPALQATVAERAFLEANRSLRIERTALAYNAGLLGAAAIAQLLVRRGA